MTRLGRMAVAAGAPLLAVPALAQAPPGPAPPEGIRVEQLLVNESARVSHLSFEPGAAETIHTHDFDLLAVLLTEGEVEMTMGDSKVRERRPRLHVTFVPRGTPHGLANVGGTKVEALGIALLGQAAADGGPSPEVPPAPQAGP